MWPHIHAAILLCHSSLAKLKLAWKGPFVLGPWLAKGFPNLASVDVAADSVTLEEGLRQVGALQSLSLSGGAVIIGSRPVSLVNLSLGGCRLTSLPSGLSALGSLEELHLHSNRLGAGPFTALPSLGRLRMLDLDSCELSSLPAEVTNLTELEHLFLNDNPNIVAEQLEVLSCLTRLEVLGVPGCNLRTLPSALSGLGRLRSLFCHNNKLRSLTGASSWLGRLSKLSLGLRELILFADDLKQAENLAKLYISRSNDPIELQCTGSGLLEVLQTFLPWTRCFTSALALQLEAR